MTCINISAPAFFREVVKEAHSNNYMLKPDFENPMPLHWLVNVNGQPSVVDAQDTSLFNLPELEKIFNMAKKCVQKGVPPQKIAVLVTYNGQLKKALELLVNGDYTMLAGIVLRTIDRYAGETNDIVFISVVGCISYNLGYPSLSSHITQINRNTVADTRARFGKAWVGEFAPMLHGIGFKGGKFNNMPFLNLIRDAVDRRRLINGNNDFSWNDQISRQARSITVAQKDGFVFKPWFDRPAQQEDNTRIEMWMSSDFAGPL